MPESHLRTLLSLLLAPGVGPETVRSVAKRFPSFAAFEAALTSPSDRGVEQLARAWQAVRADAERGRKVEQILEAVHRGDYHVTTWWDGDAYPFRLREIARPPLVLFHRRRPSAWDYARTVAVVGTRRATSYGRRAVRHLLEGLAPYRPLIVSGLAFGIDAWAHELALEVGLPTVAVLGHGLHHVYPAAHRKLAERMVSEGGDVVTEFFPWEGPERYHFPMRNRIIAGLADIVVVVESKQRGGAMITAEAAFSFNREVGAVPGPFDAAASEGPHRLIQRQMAHLITSAEDVARVMGWDVTAAEAPSTYRPETDIERRILRALARKADLTLDELATMTQLEATELSVCILDLEFRRVVENVRGQTYRLIAQVDLS